MKPTRGYWSGSAASCSVDPDTPKASGRAGEYAPSPAPGDLTRVKIGLLVFTYEIIEIIKNASLS